MNNFNHSGKDSDASTAPTNTSNNDVKINSKSQSDSDQESDYSCLAKKAKYSNKSGSGTEYRSNHSGFNVKTKVDRSSDSKGKSSRSGSSLAKDSDGDMSSYNEASSSGSGEKSSTKDGSELEKDKNSLGDERTKDDGNVSRSNDESKKDEGSGHSEELRNDSVVSTSNSEEVCYSVLPVPALGRISLYLSFRDLLACSQVCNHWRLFYAYSINWNRICQRAGVKNPVFQLVARNCNDHFSNRFYMEAYFAQNRMDKNWRDGLYHLKNEKIGWEVTAMDYKGGILAIAGSFRMELWRTIPDMTRMNVVSLINMEEPRDVILHQSFVMVVGTMYDVEGLSTELAVFKIHDLRYIELIYSRRVKMDCKPVVHLTSNGVAVWVDDGKRRDIQTEEDGLAGTNEDTKVSLGMVDQSSDDEGDGSYVSGCVSISPTKNKPSICVEDVIKRKYSFRLPIPEEFHKFLCPNRIKLATLDDCLYATVPGEYSKVSLLKWNFSVSSATPTLVFQKEIGGNSIQDIKIVPSTKMLVMASVCNLRLFQEDGSLAVKPFGDMRCCVKGIQLAKFSDIEKAAQELLESTALSEEVIFVWYSDAVINVYSTTGVLFLIIWASQDIEKMMVMRQYIIVSLQPSRLFPPIVAVQQFGAGMNINTVIRRDDLRPWKTFVKVDLSGVCIACSFQGGSTLLQFLDFVARSSGYNYEKSEFQKYEYLHQEF